MLGAHRVEASDSGSVVYGESFGRHIARDAAVVHRFLGCDKRILNEQIGLARGHLIEKIGGIVILDLCGEFVFYIVGGEVCDRCDSVHSGDERCPCLGDRVTYGGYGSESGYDYSFHFYDRSFRPAEASFLCGIG